MRATRRPSSASPAKGPCCSRSRRRSWTPCYKAAQELYAEINKTNPNFKKLYDSYTAFMADGYLWHQIADYTMDSYMIRYRNQKT